MSSINYKSLMQKRIRKVLMICSSYDAYTLEEDGRIEVQIYKEYTDLNLSNPPTFTWVTSSAEAFVLLKDNADFDLIISMFNIGDMDVFRFSKLLKRERPDIPVVLLTHFSKELYKKIEDADKSGIDYIFSWHGNADLILAIIKLFEDRMNADHDILDVGVQSILLVEDSVRYYSTYLPAIYKIVLQQGSEFLKETLNEQQQKLRKRARPKILMATNYSEAVYLYERYKENLLGVISDVAFVINKNDPASSEKMDAGIDLCKLIKSDDPHMPFLLQSSQESMRDVARELGVGFLEKYSKTLLIQLTEYISEEFAFGDFVFKDLKNGDIIGRAKDLRDLQDLIMEIPEDVLIYHGSRNRLSKWMYSRGLFSLASKVKSTHQSHFDSIDELREFIVQAIKDYRIVLGHGVVARFDKSSYSNYIWFARLGEGSLGGKARGIAFVNNMLQKYNLLEKYEGVKIMIPRTVVIATDYFDEFIKINGLQYVINSDISDEEILSEFVSSRLPESLVTDLRVYIANSYGPLAVRSSSKLEDSHYQPFAGIYSTYMIPHTRNSDQMLRLLGKAIKSVYASIYFSSSRAYIQATSNLISEEKMAVVLQDVVGTEDSGFFFPTISGVARSVNYYPIGSELPEEGIVNMAFGLGKIVVEGGKTLRFSPKHPKHVLQLSTPQLALRDTQNEMYALDLKPEEFKTSVDDSINLRKFDINQIKHFRNMNFVASTWDMQSSRLVDSNLEEGRKVITFSHILKFDTMPLAEMLCDLLQICHKEMHSAVEIEFAVNMDVPKGEDKIFSLLQIRPITNNNDNKSLEWDSIDTNDSLIYAESALGIGSIDGIEDIIYVKEESFDSAHTLEIAEEINKLNQQIREQKRNYVLIGPGRWGSSDPWLGIPIKWPNISEAKVIVECGLKNFRVEPSQGTHFFQNLTSFGVGYLTINPYMKDGLFNSEKLNSMDALHESKYLRHVRFQNPLFIYIDGRKNRGIIR
ncbi:MAG: phosphoenolpyruvate synthase [Bacteroidetes bacterium GWE2_39_28]|nr:MAG: phosphoenolpyruvate synthase [Bacteroidetes bacterium GWE2_39_28]OFZ07108.1 MAG: phosphoenolpyruvate synthase [Bacteroidetes bacterium RIFOXYB2_FULL_39_7]OFZ11125.1 MAG: phosphoenolpyruvate synthase [Bacteroidetes bacterium RIFOXYC2_FULL_39_11]HCT93911.1 phosphoenolpyruvate synthase [Rikenellaceae bacterium]